MEPARRKAYYEANKKHEIAKASERKRVYVERNRQYVGRWLAEHPCQDCGETDIVVLEFDHLENKSELVSTLVWIPVSLAKIQTEIDKCEVVCAN